MSASDGDVIRVAKLVDHGDPRLRWNLVILSEGFREEELPEFRNACEGFIARLYATPPFNEMWCAINIYCVDVASDESGAKNPAHCADNTVGNGLNPRTFFDASFCSKGIGRYLLGDAALALATAQGAVPQMHSTIAIVNSGRRGGGANGDVAWFSVAGPRWAKTGVHELGHSAFGLGDEYAYATKAYSGGEPARPNVTINTDLATLKWRDLIVGTVQIPTKLGQTNVTSDTVGLFEGALHHSTGIFRPQDDCWMRNSGVPFCAVCRRQIRKVLSRFLPVNLGPKVGVQLTDTVEPRQTRLWFTHSWPACWQVRWSVVPLASSPSGTRLEFQELVQRTSREQVNHWLEITNRGPFPVDFEARYEILSRHKH